MLALHTLEKESGFLPTPVATDAESGRLNTSPGSSNHRPTLAMMARKNLWATPTTMDKLPPKSEQALLREATVTRPGRAKPANLRDQVSNMKNWPTPTVCGNYNQANTDDRIVYTIELQAHESGVIGRLNPDWVEWLMGWPIGHTALKPLETGRYQEFVQQHGDCLRANKWPSL
jgi:hypothetical protein